MFNKIEDKIVRMIIMVLGVIVLLGIGFYLIRFLPPLIKMLGVIANVASIWLFIKYLRKEFSNKKEEDVD